MEIPPIIPAPPMPPLLFATTNMDKVREVALLLGPGWPLRTLRDLAPIPEPEETGVTFMENAILKARAYATASGAMAVAEDSGLVIDALGGAPGVQSARYPGATYPEKFEHLYRALRAHPRPWTARYVCAVAVAAPDVLYTTEGVCEGEIALEPRGTHGFGYDPIFYCPEYGRTFGEVADAEKLAVAHRGRAFRQLREWLATRVESLR